MLKPLRPPATAKAWQLVLGCYWAALFIGTHVPGTAPLVPGDTIDKVVHAIAFAILAALLATTWEATREVPLRGRLFVTWLVVVTYGAIDEWTQPFVGRHASVADWLADAVGAAVGLGLYAQLRR